MLVTTTSQRAYDREGRWKVTTGIESLHYRLKELGVDSYNEYLSSDHWKDVRSRFFRSRLAEKVG